eukprot:scaffold102141_cov18-Tisochrysis_lutea.AAC.4
MERKGMGRKGCVAGPANEGSFKHALGITVSAAEKRGWGRCKGCWGQKAQAAQAAKQRTNGRGKGASASYLLVLMQHGINNRAAVRNI